MQRTAMRVSNVGLCPCLGRCILVRVLLRQDHTQDRGKRLALTPLDRRCITQDSKRVLL